MEKKKKNQVLGNILDSLVSCLSPVMGLDGDTLDRQHFNDFEVVIFHFIFLLSLCSSTLVIEKQKVFVYSHILHCLFIE